VSADPLSPLLELPGVTEAVATSRQAVDGLLGHRVLRRRSAEVSAESLLRGAWASAVLAGSPVTLAELRAGNAEDPAGSAEGRAGSADGRAGSAADPVLHGALRVSGALAGLAGTWPSAPRQVLARLHALAARGLAAEADLGRPRADREVAHRLDVLAEVLGRTAAPAVLIAAIVQAELLSLDAFPPTSGVVARAAGRLVLIDRGLDPKSLVVPEVGQLELRAEFEQALIGYAEGSPEAVAAWIELCAAAVALGARESTAICEAIQRG
jgi:hypothetical protein